MNYLGRDGLQRLESLARQLRNTSLSFLVLVFALGFVCSPALAQYPRQQTETGQQRANEARAAATEAAREAAIAKACQATVLPAPRNFLAATKQSTTLAGNVALTWAPVPNLDPAANYLIQFQIGNNPSTGYLPRLQGNASGFFYSNAPVFYPLKFAISTVKDVKVSFRQANGMMAPATGTCYGQLAYSNPPVVVPTTSARLTGFVDLHTHPMSNLAFGGKLLYGGVDATPAGGSLLPADPDCNHNVRATSEQQALGHDGSTHGGPGVNLNPLRGSFGETNPCGNASREAFIHVVQQNLKAADGSFNNPSGDAFGYPTFANWPKWNDVTHQKMWVEWIRRAYQGGLRVMVALATNNKTIGDVATAGNLSSTPDLPTDDKSSADLQISEIQAFVGRHSDFMEVAYGSADLFRIVSANKLAVIVGMEIDHPGNFQQVFSPGWAPNPAAIAAAAQPPSPASVIAEIDRLYNEGVRYAFPIHLLDNAFGGAAAYIDLFNISTTRESGHPLALVCANPNPPELIRYVYSNADSSTNLFGVSFGVTISEPNCPIVPLPPNTIPAGSIQSGQKNSLGLTSSGRVAIGEMMHLGMLIDIDHMSQAAADQTLQIAADAQYPLNSGHNAVRGTLPSTNAYVANYSERALRADQYAQIGRLHGMAGVGSASIDAASWVPLYGHVIQAMGGGTISAGFGTDFNGLEIGMPPNGKGLCAKQPGGAFPASSDGNRTWNYCTDGVAHYGMLWDFVQDVQVLSPGTYANLMSGADYFFHTWQIAEATRDRNLGSRPHE